MISKSNIQKDTIITMVYHLLKTSGYIHGRKIKGINEYIHSYKHKLENALFCFEFQKSGKNNRKCIKHKVALITPLALMIFVK